MLETLNTKELRDLLNEFWKAPGEQPSERQLTETELIEAFRLLPDEGKASLSTSAISQLYLWSKAKDHDVAHV